MGLFSVVMLFVSSMSCSQESTQATRPNVVVIMVDDLGYADVGFNGCKDIPTPHIDKLAEGQATL